MKQRLLIISLIISLLTTIALMFGRYNDHKRINELQSQLTLVILDSAKISRNMALMLQNQGFEKCNGYYECQKRYPQALKAVEDIEAAEQKELEKKSTYKE